MKSFVSKATITRPVNVTPYTALDVVGSVLTFPGICEKNGDHIQLTTADLRIDIPVIPTGMTTFRLHLYSATPPSALADNAAFDLTAADRPFYLGYVDLGTALDLGSTLYTQAVAFNKHITMPDDGRTLYGYLQTTGGFTPAANSEVYTVGLRSTSL